MPTLAKYIRTYVIFGGIAYLCLFILASTIVVIPETHIYTNSEIRFEHFESVIIFSACWMAMMLLVYLLLSFRVKVNVKEIFLHMGVISMLGPLCEVTINTFSRYVLGESLWVYHFLPTHNGDTSLYSFCVWGMYGCHIYFMDRRFIHTTVQYKSVVFALMLSIDAIILEFVLNLTSIYYLDTYIFYYFPSDVDHLTTLAVVPCYIFAGVLASAVIVRGFKYPFVVGAIGFIVGYIFTFHM
jgi:hypothetical protein